MIDYEFWNKCANGSIRNDVAEFIDNSPLLSHYSGDKYYELEDAIVEFIFHEAEKIYREREKEYHREDVMERISELFGENGEIIVSAIPLKVINGIVQTWQEYLEDSSTYWECAWDTLDDALREELDIFGRNISEDDSWVYAAYLDSWFKTHDYNADYPVSVTEFFNCEMRDEKLAEYYIELSKQYKNTHNKDFQ